MGWAKARAYSFGAVSETFDDSMWRSVDIPHDFVVEGDYTQKKVQGSDMQKIPEMESMDSRHFAGGSLEGGTAWYRKTLIFHRIARISEYIYILTECTATVQYISMNII